MKQFTWQLMCKKLKKTLKINFLYLTRTLPHTSDRLHFFYSCFPCLSATLGCYPQLSAAPRSIPAALLVHWFAVESCGSSQVLRIGAENNNGVAENNDSAAQRNTCVAGQTLVRRKQVIFQYSPTFGCAGNKLVR